MQIKQECPTPPPIKKIKLTVPEGLQGLRTNTAKAHGQLLQKVNGVWKASDVEVDPFNEKKTRFVEAVLEDKVFSGCSQSRDTVLLHSPSQDATGLEAKENLALEVLTTGKSLSPSVRSDLSRRYGTSLANVMQSCLDQKLPLNTSLKKLQEWKELNLK